VGCLMYLWFNYYIQLYTDHVWLWNINYDVLMILDKEQITKNIWNKPKNVYSVNTCVVIYCLSDEKKVGRSYRYINYVYIYVYFIWYSLMLYT